MWSSDIKLLFLRKSTRRRSLVFGLFCAKIGLAYLRNGSVVIMPYLCSQANSTGMSSFVSILVGRL